VDEHTEESFTFVVFHCEFIWVDVLCCRKILEYMKSQNLMLNETIFNALVKGHVRKGFVSIFLPESSKIKNFCIPFGLDISLCVMLMLELFLRVSLLFVCC